jgi:hypothetical protein
MDGLESQIEHERLRQGMTFHAAHRLLCEDDGAVLPRRVDTVRRRALRAELPSDLRAAFAALRPAVVVEVKRPAGFV